HPAGRRDMKGSFPFTAPTWPGGVERRPLERRTGTDYDIAWARRYPARVARVLGSPQLHGLDRLEALEPPAIFAANHKSHLDTPLLLTSLPDRFRHRA